MVTSWSLFKHFPTQKAGEGKVLFKRDSRGRGGGRGYSVTSMSTYETNLRETLGEFEENGKLSTPRGEMFKTRKFG